jgi:hypothetical protein
MGWQMQPDRLSVLRTVLRLLTFRASRSELLHFDHRHPAFGLLCTWLVGIGRSWDDIDAGLMQHLGIGSVVYVFVLSLLLWLTVRPLSTPGHPYVQMLTFVCLTSPPGLLYAIPGERFVDAETARNINVAFLLIVATWRVALLAFYLWKALGLRWLEVLVATLLPLSIIMAPAMVFRLMEKTFEGMAGLREGQTFTDPSTEVLDFLGRLSIMAFLPLLGLYVYLVARRKAEGETTTAESSRS